MKDEKNVVERMLSEKKELLRLFVIAAILAFSVGTLGSLFADQAAMPQISVIAISLLLLVISFCLLAKDINSQLSFTEEVDALVFLNSRTNAIIPVKDYRFAEHLHRVMRAINAESKAMQSEWDKEPLATPRKIKNPTQSPQTQSKTKTSYMSIVKVTADSETRPQPKSVRLLEEAASFVLLEELSLHLSTYFNNADEDSFVKEYSREDIPDFLLKNRVLNLLSTPIEQRDIFLDAYPDDKGEPEGEICSLWGSDGSVYSRFDLVLPTGSTIKHADHGVIRIETKRLSLELSAKFTGSSGVVSPSFCANYLLQDFNDVSPRKVAIRLTGRIKAMSLFRSSGWQYYRWLDSFRERLKVSFDFPTFQSEIHWAVIEPLLFSMRRLTKSEPKSPTTGQEPAKHSE